MNRALLTRLSRLEKRIKEAARVRLRVGYLQTLPADFVGPKHIVLINSSVEDGIETCAVVERPGPPPRDWINPNCHVYLNEDDQRL